MNKIDFRRCNIIAMFFLHIPYTLVAVYGLFDAQYPKFLPLKSFLDGLYPQDWVTVRSKLLTSFSKHVETFAFSARYVLISGVEIIIIRSIAVNKVSSRYGCCLFGLFPVLLTQLEIKSLTNSSSNNVVNFLIHYYLREWLMSCGKHTP